MADQENSSKGQQIEDHKSNLPLPEQPPTTSDWRSSDQRTTGVGSGAHEGPLSGQNDTSNVLRGPATATSGAREDGAELHKQTQPMSDVGRQAKDNLEGLPRDALK